MARSKPGRRHLTRSPAANRRALHAARPVACRWVLWPSIDGSFSRQPKRRPVRESDRRPERPDRNDFVHQLTGWSARHCSTYSPPDLLSEPSGTSGRLSPPQHPRNRYSDHEHEKELPEGSIPEDLARPADHQGEKDRPPPWERSSRRYVSIVHPVKHGAGHAERHFGVSWRRTPLVPPKAARRSLRRQRRLRRGAGPSVRRPIEAPQ